MSATSAFNIEVDLPNKTKRTILFQHQKLDPNSKSINGEAAEKADHDALVDQQQLSKYLYQQLQSDNIIPTTHGLRYVDDNNEELPHYPHIYNPDMAQLLKPKQIKLYLKKALKVSCTPYNLVYTTQTGPVKSCKICCCDIGCKSPSKTLSENEVAFQLANTVAVCHSIFIFCVGLSVCIGLLIWSMDNLSENDNSTLNWIIVGVILGVFMVIFPLSTYMSVCVPTGRAYLIIDMNEDDPVQDTVYIKTGYCFNRCWRRKYVFDMDRFRGIRLERDGRPNIEDEEGWRVVMVFDGDYQTRNECDSMQCWCGPGSCGSKIWIFDTSGQIKQNMVYYVIAKFFKERYGDIYDLRFSIPRKIREDLRNYGVRDELLNRNGAWNEREWVDLQVGDDDNPLLEDIRRDNNDFLVQELRDLIEFVKTKVDNSDFSKESGIIERMLNDDSKIDEFVESYQEFKKQYSLMYKERAPLCFVKLEYSKRIMKLLASKANEMIMNDGTKQQDGAYTISTTSIEGNNDGNDGLEHSLMSHLLISVNK